MSYPVIFETKILKLSNDKIIHFYRQGGNNDREGREKHTFKAELYTTNDFLMMVDKYQKNSKPFKEVQQNYFDLKIQGKSATMFDYGSHLKRMLKRGLNYDDFMQSYFIDILSYDGIELVTPYHQIMSYEEFDQKYNELLKNEKFSYRLIVSCQKFENEKQLEDIIQNNPRLEFKLFKRAKVGAML